MLETKVYQEVIIIDFSTYLSTTFFALVFYPQAWCGDKQPKDGWAYPQWKIFPLIIPSRSNEAHKATSRGFSSQLLGRACFLRTAMFGFQSKCDETNRQKPLVLMRKEHGQMPCSNFSAFLFAILITELSQCFPSVIGLGDRFLLFLLTLMGDA